MPRELNKRLDLVLFIGGVVRDPDGDGYCVGLDMLYRSADGSCNNMKHPEWGASLTPFLRFLPPDYSDGVQAFRKARSGQELPNPRLISTTVHQVHAYEHRLLVLSKKRIIFFILKDFSSNAHSM